MADLSVNYLGLSLKNPLIVASSKLTSDIEKVKACEDAGAAAVVLKSLFEEQIVSDSGKMTENLDPTVHAEAWDYSRIMSEEYMLDGYLKLVQEAKKELSIPVIASLNCISAGKWIDYAERFEQVGADALELNVFVIPADERRNGREIENVYTTILDRVKQKVSIPIAMKIGPHFSALAYTLQELVDGGIDGLVLFNRFFKPDVDIESMKLGHADVLSSPQEIALPLQWIALLSGRLDCDFSATTGVHNSEGVIKQLLVGAKTVQLCSTLFRNGLKQIAVMIEGMEEWMDGHDFASVEAFRGSLCQENIENPVAFERSQYIKAIVGIE